MNPKNPEKQLPREGQWTTGLYDCWDDPSNCFLTCICPCITFGRIAEIIDKGNLSGRIQGTVYYAMGRIGCGWLYGGIYRAKLRGLFSLPEEPCSDFAVHGCCCICGLCQEYRELNNRGADPTIGWQANVEKWKREGLETPIIAPGMNR